MRRMARSEERAIVSMLFRAFSAPSCGSCRRSMAVANWLALIGFLRSWATIESTSSRTWMARVAAW